MRNPASVATGAAAIAVLVASVFVSLACVRSGAGIDGPATPTGTPPPGSAATPTATAPSATQTPSATPPASPPPGSTTEPTATPTPQTPSADRTPKPETAAGAERKPGSGGPETRTGKPAKTPRASAGTTKDSTGPGPSQGQEYTWHDGDRARTVTLESGLVVQPSSENSASDVVTRDDGQSSIVQRQEWHATRDTQPVFRSSGGQLMTLPGGVLLVLDDAWDQANVNRFFSENGVSTSSVERQDWAINAFFIQTKPGMPSLNLANELAVLEGVEISSPNWQTEVSLR